jgi:hypothetical protein
MKDFGIGKGKWRFVCALTALGTAALALTTARLTAASEGARERDSRHAAEKPAAPPNAAPADVQTITQQRLHGDNSAAVERSTNRSGKPIKQHAPHTATTGVRYTTGGPANDSCDNATVLPGDGVYAFTTVGASTDGEQYLCVENWACEDNGSGLLDVPTDVWFAYQATCTGTLKVSTCEQEGGFSDYDSKIAIEDGDTCELNPFGPSGSCLTMGSGCSFLGCGDDDGDNPCGQGVPWSSTVEVPIAVGQEVRIRVGGFDAAQSGTGDLLVACTGVASCIDGFCSAGEICNCSDPGEDCFGEPIPPTEVPDMTCGDGLDNDCDGNTDCADTNCDTEDTVCGCSVTCAVAAGPCDGLEDDLCFANYVDDCNVGCSRPPGDPIVYGTIADGANLCGTTGRYSLACTLDADCYSTDFCFGTCSGGPDPGAQCNPNGADPNADCLPGGTCTNRVCWDTSDIPGSRDRDYRQFNLIETSTVTYCVTEHEFVALMGISQDEGGALCDTVGVDPSETPGICEDPTCVTATLPPGSYSAYIAPEINAVNVPCGANYRITMDIAAAPPANDICAVSVDDLQCQPPDQEGHGGFVGQFSDVAAGQKAADNFRVSVGTNINQICWWGYYGTLDPVGDGCFATHGFIITYYNDDADGLRPGTVLGGPFVISSAAVNEVATNQVIPSAAGDFPEYSFTANHTNVPVMINKNYWVSVQANTTALSDECQWLWTTAGPDAGGGFGDDLAALDEQDCGEFNTVNAHSHTWCLDDTGAGNLLVVPGGPDPSGACCNEAAGTCQNNINHADCQGRFDSNHLCAALSPPCGGGACCAADGSCTNTADGACGVGSTYSDGLSCAEAACSPANTGCWDNGLPDDCSDITGSLSQLTTGVAHVESGDDFVLGGAGMFPLDSVTAYFVVEGGTPADWDSVLVTVYGDNETQGTTDTFTVDCGAIAIPDGPTTADPFLCPGGVGDCPAAAACIDVDNDCFPECAAVCTLNVAGHPEAIIDLDVRTVIAHTWQGDVSVALEHVGFGPKVNLVRRAGQAIHAGCGAGLGGDGYGQNNYGDPADDNPQLLLDDESEAAINTYCQTLGCPGAGAAGGILNFAGPAKPGGCVEPFGQLASFRGDPKNGTWRMYVSDGYGVSDDGTVERFTLDFNNFLGPGPNGKPEYNTVACAVDLTCINAGGTTCGNNTPGICDDLLIPTGGHTGTPVLEIELVALNLISATPYPAGGPNAWKVTLDVSGANVDLNGGQKYWVSVAPKVTGPDIQNFWMVSNKKAGARAQQIASATAEWSSIGDRDLAFTINSCATPCSGPLDLKTCADANNDGKRDDPCLWYECDGGSCASSPRGTGNGGQFGQADMGSPAGATQCQVDGVADGNDNFHSLRCFSNQNFMGATGYPCEDNTAPPPQVPQAFNIDAGSNASCVLDGVCDGNDAFHALRSFSNQNFMGGPGYPCACNGPAPNIAGPVEPTESTGLTLKAPRSVQPGDLVDVEIYLDGDIKTLTGFQLHVGLNGGDATGLELVDISVDTQRSDYAYAGVAGTWSAYNRSIGQMVVGMDTIEGAPARAGSYLATFTYRVPKDAAGTYVVDVQYGSSTSNMENRTYLFGYSSGPVGLTATTPATITVDQPRERESRVGMR